MRPTIHGHAPPSATPVAYDFRRPNKLPGARPRLQIASETFARQFTTVLSTTLRTVSQCSKGIHQLTYDEYIGTSPTRRTWPSWPCRRWPGRRSSTSPAGGDDRRRPPPRRAGDGPHRQPAPDRNRAVAGARSARPGAPGAGLRLRVAHGAGAGGDPPGVEPPVRQIGSPSDMVIVSSTTSASAPRRARRRWHPVRRPPARPRRCHRQLAAAGRVEADAESVATPGRADGRAPVTVSVSFQPVVLALSTSWISGRVTSCPSTIASRPARGLGRAVPRFGARPGRAQAPRLRDHLVRREGDPLTPSGPSIAARRPSTRPWRRRRRCLRRPSG